MSDRVNVGKLAADLTEGKRYPAVTGVTLWYDDEHAFTAGNDTGTVLEVDCPWATQAMANDLLSGLSGFQYLPFSVSDASLDPAAELGDLVSAGNVDSIIASYRMNGYGFSDISAEETGEDHEFTYEGVLSRKLARKVTLGESYYGTRITRAEGLVVEKTDGEDVLAKVVLNADELSFYQGGSKVLFFDPVSNTYKFTGQLNVADNFVVDASGNVTIRGNLALPVGAISFTELSQEVQDDIDYAVSEAEDASSAVQAWSYGGTTYIDGSKIMTGTVRASTLEGGSVNLLDYYGNTIGTMTMSQQSHVGISRSGGATLYIGSTIAAVGDVAPYYDNSYNLGFASNRWKNCYVASGVINSSDRREKTDIESLPDEYDALFDAIQPVRFRFIDGDSGRFHTGMISQDVEFAIHDAGLTTQDFAGFIKTAHDDDYIYGLRYEEFIALCIDQIQRLKVRVAALEVDND